MGGYLFQNFIWQNVILRLQHHRKPHIGVATWKFVQYQSGNHAYYIHMYTLLPYHISYRVSEKRVGTAFDLVLTAWDELRCSWGRVKRSHIKLKFGLLLIGQPNNGKIPGEKLPLKVGYFWTSLAGHISFRDKCM